MKIKKSVFMVLALVVLMAMQARAHDPDQHAQEAGEPDCSAMDSTIGTSSDARDPVRQAMMMRCGASMSDHDDMKAKDHPQEVNSDVVGEGRHTEAQHHGSH